MNNFPIQYEGKTYWISRSVGVVGYIFCLDGGKLLVLANKRGKGTPDFQGYWNCPCGYLDYDETTRQACAREIAEETNLYVNPDNLQLFDVEDDPSANRQNVTFRYWHFSPIWYKGQTVYAKGQEKDEVAEVKWIPIDEIDDYQFAFNQEKTIKKIVSLYLSDYINSKTQLNFKNV